jgi:putative DNA primase/helicase
MIDMQTDMTEALAGVPAPLPYPLEALPPTMRAAVAEVLAYVQCPPALAASSALAVLSTAAQGRVDVVRDHGLDGPTSLYLLAIADSGERKSTVDRLFSRALRDWQRGALDAAQPALARYRAALTAWDAHAKGLAAAIQAAAKAGKNASGAEAALQAHENCRPVPVRAPVILHTDVTPEALAWSLHTGWPSATLMTAEGGLVLGGHGMQRDSVMRHLALLNALWDGADHPIARRTSESYLLAGRRLTLWIQVQAPALAQYLADRGALARGMGWLARCLIARPQTTQGARAYQSPPPTWPKLGAYQARIRALLDEPLPMDGERLRPRQMWLCDAARAAWIEYHDEVERDLGPGGELATVRDAAAKAADNAARLAALLATYEGRTEVAAEDIEHAASIVTWHLSESRRVLGTAAAAQPQADAALLTAWVGTHGPASRREVQRGGPPALRDGARLDAATLAATATGALTIGADGVLTPARGGDGAR